MYQEEGAEIGGKGRIRGKGRKGERTSKGAQGERVILAQITKGDKENERAGRGFLKGGEGEGGTGTDLQMGRGAGRLGIKGVG